MPDSAFQYATRGMNLLILTGWLVFVSIFDRNLLAVDVSAIFLTMVAASDFVAAHRLHKPPQHGG